MSAGVYEAEEVLAAKYRAGLRTTIHDDMAGSRIWTVEEAYQVALQIEEVIHAAQTNLEFGSYTKIGTTTTQDNR